jgi:hypothetical protein
VRGEFGFRDYDVVVVLTEKQFAARYATAHMNRKMTPREILTRWCAEEWGHKEQTGLYDRWMEDQRKHLKDAFHKWTALHIDFQVLPLSHWRKLDDVQFWRLA